MPMSNSELGRYLRCSVTTASRLKSNKRRPTLEMVLVAQRRFGWDIADQVHHAHNNTWGSRLMEVTSKRA